MFFYGVMLGIFIVQKKELKKYDGTEFPVQEKDFSKIEMKNNISGMKIFPGSAEFCVWRFIHWEKSALNDAFVDQMLLIFSK